MRKKKQDRGSGEEKKKQDTIKMRKMKQHREKERVR